MKSPFPGMDPYIEAHDLWTDFHAKLISEIERALAAAVPDRYFVQTGERGYIILAGADGQVVKTFYPDVSVSTDTRPQRLPNSGAMAIADPETKSDTDGLAMRAFIDEHFRENFIEIYEADPEFRLVTCIEVLSPANTRRDTEGWNQYLRKRNALLLGQANFVEIDLVRSGKRMPMVEPWPDSPYYLLVSRKLRAPYCRVFPVGFLRPLTTIPVPLADPDPDVPLCLQPMIDAVYERSRYARRIDYSKPLDPPLPPDVIGWLAQQINTRDAAATTDQLEKMR